MSRGPLERTYNTVGVRSRLIFWWMFRKSTPKASNLLGFCWCVLHFPETLSKKRAHKAQNAKHSPKEGTGRRSKHVISAQCNINGIWRAMQYKWNWVRNFATVPNSPTTSLRRFYMFSTNSTYAFLTRIEKIDGRLIAKLDHHNSCSNPAIVDADTISKAAPTLPKNRSKTQEWLTVRDPLDATSVMCALRPSNFDIIL